MAVATLAAGITASAILVADDLTGVGVADDVLLPGTVAMIGESVAILAH